MFAKSFSIAFVFCVVSTAWLIGQETVNDLRSKSNNLESINQANNVIYLPSPFASEGELAIGVPLPKSVRSTGQDNSRSADSAKSSPDTNFQQIAIETYTLIVDETGAQQIFSFARPDSRTFVGTDIGSGWPTSRTDSTFGKNTASCHSISVTPNPVSYGEITEDGLEEIKQLAIASPSIQFLQAPTTVSFENQEATVFDGKAVSFVVGVKPGPDGNGGFKNVPVIQQIEEGVIFQHRATVSNKGIRLNTKVTRNKITDVDTFTFDGNASSSEVTIQIPQFDCKQLQFSLEIQDGNLLLIDPNMIESSSEPVGKRGFVDRLVGNADFRASTEKTMFIVKARVVEGGP